MNKKTTNIVSFSYKPLLWIVVIMSLLFFTACKSRNPITEESTSNSKTQIPDIKRVISVDLFPNSSLVELQTAYGHFDDMPCFTQAYYAASYEMATGGYRLLQRLRSGESNYILNTNGICVGHDTDESWDLTPLPRAIYNLDGSIKYYEFGFVENGYVTAIITVNASKKELGAIAYIFPYVLSYSHSNYTYYYIPNNYPHRAYFDGTDYHSVDNPEIVLSYDEMSGGINWEIFRDQASQEDIRYMDSLSLVAQMGDPDYDDDAAEYWDNMEEGIVRFVENDPCFPSPNTSHKTRNEYIESLREFLGDEDCYCRDYTASHYCGTALQQTYWDGFCGPSGLAWIYRGLFDKYPAGSGMYLPLHGDISTSTSFFGVSTEYSFYTYGITPYALSQIPWYDPSAVRQIYMDSSIYVDNKLTGHFYDECYCAKLGSTWYVGLWPLHLDPALKSVTNNSYGVSGEQTALYTAEWIYNRNLPAMLLFTDLSHYLVAYGYGYTYNDANNPEISRSRLYFLVTDDGYKISEHAYKPYWRKYKKCEYYHCVKLL